MQLSLVFLRLRYARVCVCRTDHAAKDATTQRRNVTFGRSIVRTYGPFNTVTCEPSIYIDMLTADVHSTVRLLTYVPK